MGGWVGMGGGGRRGWGWAGEGGETDGVPSSTSNFKERDEAVVSDFNFSSSKSLLG